MKTAGVRFDFYDDPSGALLKHLYPTAEELPQQIKEAHILRPEERDALRDEAYALVMSNEGKVFRKFACVDAGNTVLSVLYFGQSMDLLSKEAQAVAATNLLAACGDFGIEPPLFLKSAARKADQPKAQNGMSRTRDPMSQPIVGDDADWGARTNLQSVTSGKDGGRVNDALGAMQPKIATVVDVTGHVPVIQFKKKEASRHALDGRYPLDSYTDVEAAAAYFDDFWKDMAPSQRHEFAVKTASRADELGIEVSDALRRYGSVEYAPDVDAHLANRLANINDKEDRERYQALREKRASVHPEQFAQLLTAADIESGLCYEWGGAVCDPYMSTFGSLTKAKTASWSWESEDGTLSIDAEQLRALATAGREKLSSAFDSSFTESFIKDPTTIFDSMPAPHKAVLVRLANE